MPSPTLDALANRLLGVSQSMLDTTDEDFPAIAALLLQRQELLHRIAGEVETNPASATDQARANLSSAEEAGRRMAENLSRAREGLCGQLQALYRYNFHLRGWLAEAINQPQELDCRG